MPDPNTASYVVLTNIVYCNLTKPDLPVENMVAGGYGSNIGQSLASGIGSLSSVAGMVNPLFGMAGSAASGVIGSISGMFSGPSSPSAPKQVDDVITACVADLQITERAKAVPLPPPS